MDIEKKIIEISGMFEPDFRKLQKGKNRLFIDIAIDNPNMLSYYTMQKLDKLNEVNPDYQPFDADTRKQYGIMTKTGRLINALFSDTFNQSKIKNIINGVNAILNNDLKLELLTGIDNVLMAYDGNNYCSEGQSNSSLNNSCMRHSSCQSYLRFYNNYDVDILVLKNNDGVIYGRALVWNEVQGYNNEKLTLMDRIYTCNEKYESLFIEYAKKHNIAYKAKQSYSYKQSVVIDECSVAIDLYIDSKNGCFESDNGCPYLDTFTYCDDNGTLSNYDVDCYALESTNGSYEGNGDYIIIDGERYHQDDVVYSEVYDDYIIADYAIFVDGDYYREDDNCIVYVDGEYYHIDSGNVVYSDYEGSYIHVDNSCFSEHHGDYFNSDDVFYCDIKEDYFLNDTKIWSDLHEADICEELAEYTKMQGSFYRDECDFEYFRDLHTDELVEVYHCNNYVIDYNGNSCSIDEIVVVGGYIFNFETYQEWREM